MNTLTECLLCFVFRTGNQAFVHLCLTSDEVDAGLFSPEELDRVAHTRVRRVQLVLHTLGARARLCVCVCVCVFVSDCVSVSVASSVFAVCVCACVTESVASL